MNIDAIRNGIVIDHIRAGKAMEIYKLLNLEALDCSVAIIKNAPSELMGKKDIIKIDRALDVDLDALGYIDPDITINVIVDGVLLKSATRNCRRRSPISSSVKTPAASPPRNRNCRRCSSSPTAKSASTAASTARARPSSPNAHPQPRRRQLGDS